MYLPITNITATMDILVGGYCNITVDVIDGSVVKRQYLFLQTLGTNQRRTVTDIKIEDKDRVNITGPYVSKLIPMY